ncbi:MAG: ubiquitin-like protein Pup [Actinomycetaceae bacterium]|nr:ubiquitin-like protein Pup [Actinomycetaceae bacterium]
MQQFTQGDPGKAEEGGQIFESASAQVEGIDDLLDEIDEVLSTNAESFVQGFVQKGGQ